MTKPVVFDENRICIKAVIAGVHGINGGDHPRCLGKNCSEYQYCRHEDEYYARKYNSLKSGKKPSQKTTRDDHKTDKKGDREEDGRVLTKIPPRWGK